MTRSLTTAAAAMAMFAAALQAQTRSWVSNNGSDANPCTIARPCATFQGAYNKTPAGGEIDVLSSGEYGPLTISHSITIDGQGTLAGISLGKIGTAITINAGSFDLVILRNLSLTSTSAFLPPGAARGIEVDSAHRVDLYNISISNFIDAIDLVPRSGALSLTAAGLKLADSFTYGIGINPLGGATVNADIKGLVATNTTTVGAGVFVAANEPGFAFVSLDQAAISGGLYGVYAFSACVVTVKNSSISNTLNAVLTGAEASAVAVIGNTSVENNSIGLNQLGLGVLKSYGNNLVANNGSNMSGTISSITTM